VTGTRSWAFREVCSTLDSPLGLGECKRAMSLAAGCGSVVRRRPPLPEGGGEGLPPPRTPRRGGKIQPRATPVRGVR
jgi:hypothetical protein